MILACRFGSLGRLVEQLVGKQWILWQRVLECRLFRFGTIGTLVGVLCHRFFFSNKIDIGSGYYDPAPWFALALWGI